MTPTMRRLYTRKAGCKLRLAQTQRENPDLPIGPWTDGDDQDWQQGLSVEVRRVKK